MKRFLFGLILGIGLSAVVAVKAQSPPPLSVSDCDNPPWLRASINCPVNGTVQAGRVFICDTGLTCEWYPRAGNPVVLQNPATGTVEVAANPHEHDLTVKEIVEMLAEIDVHHAKQQPFFQPAYGATTFQTTPVQVWIFDDADTAAKRSTVLHELMHVHCHNAGIDCSEEYVASEEQRQYQKLFGVVQ